MYVHKCMIARLIILFFVLPATQFHGMHNAIYQEAEETSLRGSTIDLLPAGRKESDKSTTGLADKSTTGLADLSNC